MTHSWSTSLRAIACAASLCAVMGVQAQTTPAPADVPPPAAPAQVAPPPPPGHPEIKHDAHHPKHHKPKHHRKAQRHGGSASKYATPHQHEAAAVQDERRRGMGPANPGGAEMTAFQHNALKRCDVFKSEEDRHACVERVRQGSISGSVSGGGILREYTQTVPQ